MTQRVLQTGELPMNAIEATMAFRSEHAEEARRLIATKCTSLVIILPPATHDHVDWRRAAARDLARFAAPTRVNLVAGDDRTTLDAAIAFLAAAPGVTGQYLPLGSQSVEDASD